MNQLVQKVITFNNETCPPFTYENPLLDRNVVKALSRSFVNLLKVTGQNSNINSSLRLSVLENIRKLCKFEPEQHVKVNESLTELLTELYENNIKNSVSSNEDTTEKMLEAFLIRRLRDTDMVSSIKPSINLEIVQALVNLNDTGVHTETLTKDLIHWRSTSKCKNMLKDLWKNENFRNNSISKSVVDDISLKMKADIETTLLQTCHNILENKTVDVEEIFTSNNAILQLVKTSAVSPQCFQICCNVLNLLFIQTDFEDQILNIISTFISYVKLHCLNVSFSLLYPSSLSNIVLLLDIDITQLPSTTQSQYIDMSVKHLHNLHTKCESDFILLLSHYPDWFDLYFRNT